MLACDEDRLAPAPAEPDGVPEALRHDLARCGGDTPLFEQDNRQALAGILGAMDQTFDHQPRIADNGMAALTITPVLLNQVATIAEALGRWSARQETSLSPRLRRDNRIQTIQASLAIEQNSLNLEQVSALFEGKRVIGPARDIQEVRNAIAAYDALPRWDPANRAHLLDAHGLLMAGLIDGPGRFRAGGVGIFRGDQLVHMAPPAVRVPQLVADLLGWLAASDWHPLIVSCVTHYELEFIHPFTDGNGRLGRLWQTLILSHWNPLLPGCRSKR